MAYAVLQGCIPATVNVSLLPDRSGNFVCDGVADHVQILAAFAYLLVVGGGEVVLLKGHYYIVNNLTSAALVTLRGVNKNAVIISQTVDGTVIRPQGYWSIRDLTVSNSGFDGPTITLWAATNYVTIQNCILVGQELAEPAAGATVYLEGILHDLRLIDCEVRGGAHNGLLSNAMGAYNVWIVGCWFHANFDDAIDPNGDYFWFIVDCLFTSNNFEIVSFELGCHDSWVVDCKTDGRRVFIGASYRIFVIGCCFEASGVRKTMGIRVGDGSYDVHIIGCQVTDSNAAIYLYSSNRIIITNCILCQIYYNDPCLSVVDCSYIMVVSCIIMSTVVAGTFWKSIKETGQSDYNLYYNIFLYNPNSTDQNYASFVGANSVMENIFGNSPFRDDGGVMTGTVGLRFGYEDQQGQVSNISTAVAGKVSAAVVFTRRYPSVATPKVPKVTLSLVDVAANVTIDTVEAKAVTATGFTYSLRVVANVAATTCKLQWRAHIDRWIA